MAIRSGISRPAEDRLASAMARASMPVAILQTVEPAFGDVAESVVSAGQGAEDGPGGVGVAAQVDDLGEGFLEAVGRQQDVEAGWDAGWGEAHGRTFAGGLGPVPVGFLDQSRQGPLARQVEHGLGMGEGPRQRPRVLS